MSVSLLQRRHVLAFLATSALYAALPTPVRAAPPDAALADLERRHGGRLGVWVHDAADGSGFGHRGDERFAMCSTFKLLLAAMVLREAADGRLDLNTRIHFSKDDLVPYAPVIEQHLEQGSLSIEALAHAAQVTSDNVAANLLLRHLGGPEGFTARLRELGDAQSRLDRLEPELNLVPSGEVRDTTTPRAMATTVARLFSAGLLDHPSQAQLKRWLIDTRTGLNRLRAGLPDDWETGDKTGTAITAGMPNQHNDVAVIWRRGKAPVVVAAYYQAHAHYPSLRAQDDAVLAEVGRIVARRIG